MGSGSSKFNAAPSSPSSSSRSTRGIRGFQSSCLGQSSRSHDSDYDDDDQASDHPTKENGSQSHSENQNISDSEQMKAESYRKAKVEHDNTICISSNIELDEWGQSGLSDTVSRTGSSSSRVFSTQSSNPSTHFLSRFKFLPGNVSLRLSRATSLGSSRAYPDSSTAFAIPNTEEELHIHRVHTDGLTDRNGTPPICGLLPACLSNRSSRPRSGDFASSDSSNSLAPGYSEDFQDDQITSAQIVATDIDNNGSNFNVNVRSPRSHNEIEGTERRFVDRWSGAREPVERNVRFSRTLSVGRLRDRVLRRSSTPDLPPCPLPQERPRDTSQDGGRHALGGGSGTSSSDRNTLISSISSDFMPSSMHSSLYRSQDYELEVSRSREARYNDLFEHRSNFLERRRRIRSQVRALQRLGSRFENLSGHERSCILSGQHRTGRCTCRINTRDANTNDDSNARASISRIVMLAEALFEVLDEIHQQSVVLSSRPSVSSIGSVPAPNEVVECLPLKLYSKSQKQPCQESAQCYICLVEYEDGDSMRILPCHHEFHRACVDKWLKEIHRVCPLCRGDICRSGTLPAEN